MITLYVSFLLCVKIPEKPPKKPKRKPIKKKRKRLQSPFSESPTAPLGDKSPVCIQLAYTLRPLKFKFKLNVISNGVLVKISSKVGGKIMETFQDGSLTWIPVYVEHSLAPLSPDQLKAFAAGKLQVKVSQKKLGKKKVVFVEPPPKDKVLVLSTSGPSSAIINSGPPHERKITRLFQGNYAKTRDVQLVQKRGKKSVQSYDIQNIFLFCEPNLTTFRCKQPPPRTDIVEVFILVTAHDLFTPQQVQELSPLFIKIQNLRNFPLDALREVAKIGVNCRIPGVGTFKVPVQDKGANVRFDYLNYLFMGGLQAVEVLEVFQTKRLVLEVFGVMETPSRGSKKRLKKTKKKRGKVTEIKKEEVLALATFDLSPLTHQCYFLFKEKGQCHNPMVLFGTRNEDYGSYFLDRCTVNELNVPDLGEAVRFLVPEEVLLQCGTTIDFEAFFLAPKLPLYPHIPPGWGYHRLLLVSSQNSLAAAVLKMVLDYNFDKTGLHPRLEPDQILSGFLIDDGNSVILFIEGPRNGYLHRVYQEISHIDRTTGLVFYNSDYLFGERVYEAFTPQNGLLLVTLKYTLREILQRTDLYVGGNVPRNCFKALQKLDLICQSTSFKSVLEQELLPNAVELVSFAVEFGVQFEFNYDDWCTEEKFMESSALNAEDEGFLGYSSISMHCSQ